MKIRRRGLKNSTERVQAWETGLLFLCALCDSAVYLFLRQRRINAEARRAQRETGYVSIQTQTMFSFLNG